MPVLDVYNLDRKKTGTLELSDAVFDADVREHLFHEVVRSQMGARRAGNASTKERHAIRGSVHKVWRQKGTGRARQGSKKAPQWVGGGVVFGPHPRKFDYKVNKKTRRAALRSALSRRQQEGRLVIIDDFSLAEIKTKAVAKVMGTFESPKTLIVDVDNNTLASSARNLSRTRYVPVAGLNVYDILKHDTLMMTSAAAKAIEGRLA